MDRTRCRLPADETADWQSALRFESQPAPNAFEIFAPLLLRDFALNLFAAPGNFLSFKPFGTIFLRLEFQRE
ncbi:MAG TPA: hypothetical protein VIV82_12080, partial [Verrucomicrobiae bacterium]